MIRLKAAPAAQAVLDAIDVLREMNMTGARKVPDDAPIAFVKALEAACHHRRRA
jgi:hypothetical protein